MKKCIQYVFIFLLGFLFLCGLSTAVWAIPITMQFTAANFVVANGPDPAPTDPVTGTIVWDAASVNSTINSLTSINLTTDTHTYALGEVGFLSPISGDFDAIGGSMIDVGTVALGADDFHVAWNTVSLVPVQFIYSSSNFGGGAWNTLNFTSFSITSSAVPEPATMLLFGTGLVGLVGFRRKFRK